MIIGNGTSKKKIATKAAAAMPHRVVLERPLADAHTASSTIASTAAFRPKNSAATMPTLPNSGVDPAQGHDGEQPGSTNSVPATSPPLVLCISQPI
jgi:hypothetical protein